MALIDELQILITADSRAIESTLKRTIQTVAGTVDKINSQEVDWTSIFTRSVSPAIIGGVASVFAFAISNAMQFQEALNTAGTAAGVSAGQIGQVGQAALNLAGQVAQSPQDLANAMLLLGQIFPNVNDQTSIAAAMAKLASSGFGNLNDIVAISVNLFKEWGVTTQDQAIAVLTSLMHGAEAAKESIPALAQQFDQFSPPLLRAGANLGSFNGLVATFASEIKNVGSAATIAMFQALATSANTPVGPMELLGKATNTAGLSMDALRNSIRSGGALEALVQTSVALGKLGDNAELVAKGFGFSSQQLDAFNIQSKHLPGIAADASLVANNTETIDQANQKAASSMRDLLKLWYIFEGESIVVFDLLAKGFLGSIKLLDDLSAAIANTLRPAINAVMGDLDKVSNATAGFIKDTTGKLQGLSNSIYGSISNSMDKVSNQMAGLKSGSDMENIVSTYLKGSGFNKNQINAIESKAESTGILSQLYGALMTGLVPSNSSYSQIRNTFNLSVPASGHISAEQLTQQLYNAFQNTK